MKPGSMMARMRVVKSESGSKRMNGIGRMVAIQDPTEGMKLSTKAMRPKSAGKGAPIASSESPTLRPVAADSHECTTM